MFSTYRAILTEPGTAGFTAAGALGRLPLSMTGLGIILLISSRTDEYGPAAIVSAVYVLVSAVFAPVQGRLADRFGQAPVLVVAGLLFAVGITGLLLTVDTSLVAAGCAAAVAGIGAPQTGSMSRARWTHALSSDRSRLQTAFALEAVLDEVVFIVGPVLVTVLTLSALDWSGLAVAGVAAIVGAWGMAAQRSTQPPHRRGSTAADAPLVWRLLGPLVLAAVGLGILFGSAEVLVVAFTDEQGERGLAGLVLAVWSVGSLVAGLVVGSLPATVAPVHRLRWTTTGLVLLFAPLGFAPNTLLLAVGFFVAGLMVAPTLITAVHLVELPHRAGAPHRGPDVDDHRDVRRRRGGRRRRRSSGRPLVRLRRVRPADGRGADDRDRRVRLPRTLGRRDGHSSGHRRNRRSHRRVAARSATR